MKINNEVKIIARDISEEDIFNRIHKYIEENLL